MPPEVRKQCVHVFMCACVQFMSVSNRIVFLIYISRTIPNRGVKDNFSYTFGLNMTITKQNSIVFFYFLTE